jgi:DNA repair protein RadD
MTLREYQKRPTAIAIDFFNSNKSTPKVMVFPTGWGKSHLIAHVIKEVGEKFLIIQPSKELLEQNYEKYVSLGEEASIYSASLNKKEFGNITFATIGSIKALGADFKKKGVKYVIIDECDRYPQEDGMLPSFIVDLAPEKVLGITATPIKLKKTKWGQRTETLTTGKRSEIFYTDIIHVSQIQEMVRGGWWAPLKYEQLDADESMLVWNTTGNEYTDKSMANFYAENGLEKKIIQQINSRPERKSWLIFVPSIEDANSLESKLEGVKAVTNKTPAKLRKQYVADYKAGNLRGLISINALSVGFDHPPMDGIISARPTGSISWYAQSLGRGVRTHSSKKDCLIIDFSGNVRKFGPIENMFYAKSNTWDLYGKDNRKLSGYTPKSTLGLITTPQGVKMKKNNIMPFGQYRGVRVRNLPPQYIVFLKERIKEIHDVSVRAEIEILYNQYKFI